MKKNGLFTAFLLSALFISFFALQAQAQNRSTITGYVFNEQRRPVSQIPVELLTDVNSVIQRTRTDGSGRFFFSGLPSGRFAIRVMPLGTNYEEQTQEVEIAGIGVLGRALPDNIQKDVYLRLRKDKNNERVINGAIFVQEVPETAKKIYEKAIANLGANNIEITVGELQKSLEIFPDYYLALEGLGLIYLKQQKYENAIEILTKAVAVNSRSFNGWYGLSYAHYSLQHSDAAIECAQKAVSLNSNSVEALMFLGVSQRQAKQYKEAEKSLVQAKKLDNEKTPDVYWNLALLYAHNLKRYKDAADELEIYLKISPDSPNAENVKKLIKQFRENANASN